MEEERAAEPSVTDDSVTDALTARTRALVEESRALLRRLEELLAKHDDDDAEAADGGEAGS